LWYCLRLRRETPLTPAAWGMYRYSLLYLALLFAAMGIDRALPFGGPSRPGTVYILDQAVAEETGAVPVGHHPAH
ncbi:MAG TPA: hypothetical protein VFT84_04855, partial [Gemmatimonadales bacterium]|nr:hypothetical protein [Gemmatimonadales bacterium]